MERGVPPEFDARNHQIDAMRGIAALAVMMYHYTYWYGYGDYGGIAVLNDFAAPPIVSIKWGSLGVELFFMISGFVLPASAFRYQSMKSFAIGRFLRLFPAYWLAVLFASFVYHASNADLGVTATYKIATLVNLSMIQTLLGFPHISGVFWTLYVELQFYFLLVATSLLLGKHWFFRVVVALALLHLCLVMTDAYDWIPGLWRMPNHLPLFSNLQYFMLGSAIHQMVSNNNEKRPTAIALLAVFIFLVGNLNKPAIILIGITFCLACSQSLKFLDTKVLVWFGTISYSLYLFHSPIGFFALNRFQSKMNTNLVIFLSVVISISLACLVCFCVERPIYKRGKVLLK